GRHHRLGLHPLSSNRKNASPTRPYWRIRRSERDSTALFLPTRRARHITATAFWEYQAFLWSSGALTVGLKPMAERAECLAGVKPEGIRAIERRNTWPRRPSCRSSNRWLTGRWI